MVEFFSLLFSAALPILSVFLMSLLGFVLTRKGILDGRARKVLSQLIFWVFVPSMVFTKLASSVDLNNVAIWWILPVNMMFRGVVVDFIACSIILGMVIGWISARFLKVEPWFGNHFICAVATGNVGNLPFAVVQSLCSNKQSLFATLLPDGTCEQKGLAYVAFSMWIASTFQYSIAFNLMKKVEPSQSTERKISPSKAILGQDQQVESGMILQMVPIEKAQPHLGKGQDAPAQEILVQIQAGQSSKLEEDNRQQRLDSGLGHLADEVQGDEESDRLMSQLPSSAPTNQPPGLVKEIHWWDKSQGGSYRRRKKQKEIQRWLKSIPWGSYLNMPTLAAIAGLSVGCVSIAKDFLFGEATPLLCLTQSLETMAGGMIPSMMLMLGSSLSKRPSASSLSKQVIIGCLVVRLIIMPALGTAFVLGLLKLGCFSSADPLFLMVLLVIHCPPTALNLQTVATLNQNGEEEMSCLLCWQYLTALITMPLWLSLYILIVSA